jgi:hypothetical protein
LAQAGDASDPNTPTSGISTETDASANTTTGANVDSDNDEIERTSTGVDANANANANPQAKFARWVHPKEVVDGDHIRPSNVRQSTNYETLLNEQRSKGQGRYGKFGDKEVWETAQFMVDCLGKGATDRFLNLARVSSHNRMRSDCD